MSIYAPECTRCHTNVVRALTEPGGRQILLDATPAAIGAGDVVALAAELADTVLDPSLAPALYELNLDALPQAVARAWRPAYRTQVPERAYRCHIDTCTRRSYQERAQ